MTLSSLFTRIPIKSCLLALGLLAVALSFGARRGGAISRRPQGADLFVDSGQALGDNASRDVALGDVDGDGDVDALVANANAALVLWINQGGEQGGDEGTFAASTQVLGGFSSNSVVLEDLDGDGDLDAVAIGNNSDDAVRVLVNQGPGNPGVFVHNGQTVSDILSGVAAGDVNEDDLPDLFITTQGFGNQVWLNAGGSPVQFTDSGQRLGDDYSTSAALADVDGDGDVDAYVGNTLGNGSAANAVWLNQGGGTGQFAQGMHMGTTNTMAVAAGDVDADGDVDVLAVNSGIDRLWVNSGSFGQFVDSGQSLDEGLSMDGVLADVNGDAYLDAFVANIGGGSTVWLNDGTGGLIDGGQRLGEAFGYGVAVGDVNGDGAPDAFVANDGPNQVWLNLAPWPNQGADVAVSLPPTEYLESEGSACGGYAHGIPLTVRNAGPAAASNVIVSTNTGRIGLGSSTYFVGTLAAGESVELEVNFVPYTLVHSGTLYCAAPVSARVVADQPDQNVVNNEAATDRALFHCDELCALEEIFCQISPPEVGPETLWQVLQEGSIDLLVYVYVRQGILAGTPEGQHYIDLYETHDAEIKGLLQAEEAFADEAIATLQVWEPNLWALVRGRGDEATITAQQVTAVDDFLNTLSGLAGPALQQTITAERNRLPPPETFIGMTMEEARAATVGYGVFLPALSYE